MHCANPGAGYVSTLSDNPDSGGGSFSNCLLMNVLRLLVLLLLLLLFLVLLLLGWCVNIRR